MDVGGIRSGRAKARAVSLAGSLLASASLVGCGSLFDLAGADNSQNQTDAACHATALSDRYIVKWRDGSVTSETAKTHEEFAERIFEPNKYKIEYAERDHLVRLTPPATVQQESSTSPAMGWGQSITNAPAEWRAGNQGSGVIVAVVDSGADVNHPQLASQLAGNPGEIGFDAAGRDKSFNGVDDDGNGLIDDAYGYDFYQKASLVGDANGHGTHVSGIIAANPSMGPIQGMAPRAKILPIAFMGADGAGLLSDSVLAIRYAVARGAKVINASWGGTSCTQLLQTTVARLSAQGVLFVVAAGNNGDGLQPRGADLARIPVFPAAFGLTTQMVVGASTPQDHMAAFSNFSSSLVDLVAPGELIVSTWPGGGTRSMDGTSMATPFVSGAAAMLWAYRPKATPAQIKAALLAGVDPGAFAVASQGRLDVRAAIQALGSTVAP